MAALIKRVYWDACAWIALIQKEKLRDENGKIIEDRFTMCSTVIYAAEKHAIEIVTSSLSLVEVCKVPQIKLETEDRLALYFEHDYILLANLDREVGERARQIMQVGYSKLKPPDAAHLATAAISNVDEMHTFDGRLLDLDGRIKKPNGESLKICKPDHGTPMPLLDQAGESAEEDESIR